MRHPMKNTLTLAAALLASPWVMAQDAMSERELRAVVQEALDLAKQERWSEACTRSRAMGRLEAMRTGDEAERAKILANAGYLHVGCERWEDAYWVLKASTTLLPDAWPLYHLAMATEETGRHRETVEAFEIMAAREPAGLTDVAADRAWRTFHALEGDRPTQRRLLQAFADANYFSYAGDSAFMWLALAEMHLEVGRPDLARKVVERVTNVRDRFRLHVDRRFDAPTTEPPSRFDVRATAQHHLGLIGLQAEFNPENAYVWRELAETKLVMGDHAGLIDWVTRLLKRVGEPDPDDRDERSLKNGYNQAWLLYSRGVAHARLGDTERALADMKRAVEMPMTENGRALHRRHLAQLQCYLGNPTEAMQLLRGLDQTFSLRETIIDVRILHCVAAQSGDPDLLPGMVTNSERIFLPKNPMLAVESHLWAGSIDGAERILIDRLESTEFRGEALLFVQSGLHTNGMPGRSVFDRNRKALLARPAVKAAIEKVGRLEHVDAYLGFGLE